jgi:hypothetical protein
MLTRADTVPVPPTRRQTAERRGLQNRRGENTFIRDVLQRLRGVTLTGTEVDRLNLMRRLYQQGYSAEDAAIEIMSRFTSG